MSRLAASWFDGRSAGAHAVELDWEDGQLLLISADQAPRRYPARQIVWPERTRHGQRQLLLPDGGVVSLPDAQAWDQWAAAAGLAQPLAARWALHWRGALLATVLLIALLLAAWRWGIPWGAQQAADWVPLSVERAIGDQVMEDLAERGWLKPSELPAGEQQAIREAVAAMIASAYAEHERPAYRLHIHRAPRWLGPNAFALPGGDIVVTDALVELLRSEPARVPPALLGVVAHELGHVRAKHGLRMLFEASAVSVLLGWWIGDYSSVLALAPTLMAQTAYSRDHERSADAESLRVMKAAGIDPRAMVQFFAALKKLSPERRGDDPAFGLSTHPADSERVRYFEQGALAR